MMHIKTQIKIILILALVYGPASGHSSWFTKSGISSLKQIMSLDLHKMRCGGYDLTAIITEKSNELERRIESVSGIGSFLEELYEELRLGEIIPRITSQPKHRTFSVPSSEKGLAGLLDEPVQNANIVHQVRNLSYAGLDQLIEAGEWSSMADLYNNRRQLMDEANRLAQEQVHKKDVHLADGEGLLSVCFLNLIVASVEEIQHMKDRGVSTYEMMLTLQNLKNLYNYAKSLLPVFRNSGSCRETPKSRGAFVRVSKDLSFKAFGNLVSLMVGKFSPGVTAEQGPTLEIVQRLVLFIITQLFSQPTKCDSEEA